MKEVEEVEEVEEVGEVEEDKGDMWGMVMGVLAKCSDLDSSLTEVIDCYHSEILLAWNSKLYEMRPFPNIVVVTVFSVFFRRAILLGAASVSCSVEYLWAAWTI